MPKKTSVLSHCWQLVACCTIDDEMRLKIILVQSTLCPLIVCFKSNVLGISMASIFVIL
ncbi:MAG: hypothetical protein ACTHML_20950 [Ginsengibacter sp.]